MIALGTLGVMLLLTLWRVGVGGPEAPSEDQDAAGRWAPVRLRVPQAFEGRLPAVLSAFELAQGFKVETVYSANPEATLSAWKAGADSWDLDVLLSEISLSAEDLADGVRVFGSHVFTEPDSGQNQGLLWLYAVGTQEDLPGRDRLYAYLEREIQRLHP